MSVAGLLLAAGAGRRMGTPKALLRDERDVPYVDRALGRLLDGGCDLVTVVLGAAADEVRAILDEDGWCVDPAVDVVVAEDWAEGMGASLRAGLAREVEIVRTRAPEVPAQLAEQVVGVVQRLRSDEQLLKPPGVAETLDWARALNRLGTRDLDVATAAATLGAVVKYREDAQRVRQALDRILTT